MESRETGGVEKFGAIGPAFEQSTNDDDGLTLAQLIELSYLMSWDSGK